VENGFSECGPGRHQRSRGFSLHAVWLLTKPPRAPQTALGI
jgi:hypothetical protein